MREADFDFRSVWFGGAARHFRETTGEVEACKGCYHHCFISPTLFRSPKMWRRMIEAAWQIHRNLNAPEHHAAAG